MLFEDSYKTLKGQSTGNFRDRGSKFIGMAFPVQTENEVKDIVKELKKKYFNATHHCYAYVLGFDKSAYRINDDGEPSGSAGKPIYGQLLSNDLTNILIVVIRYYGGTKLGVSGLINAYKTAAAEAIANGEIITKIVNESYEVKFEYAAMNDVMRLLKNDHIKQTKQEFDLQCKIEFSLPRSEAEKTINSLKKLDNVSISFIQQV